MAFRKDHDQELHHLEEKVNRLEERVDSDERLNHRRFAELDARVTALEAAASDVRFITIVQNVPNGGSTMAKQRRFAAVATVGVNAGSIGNFSAIPSPAASAFATPPVFSSDNPLAVVSIDTTDPTGATVNVAVDPTATGSFNLSATYTNPDGVVATAGTLNVPILAGPPPPPVDVTSITIQQNS